jgi:glycosyltransferase involved in cell wall biosynthesis
MRVAIDLRPLQVGHENRGIGNYLLNILGYFPTEDIEYIFVRYSQSNPIKDYSLDIGKNPYREVVIKRHKFGRRPKLLILFMVGLLDPVFLKVKLHRPNIFFQADPLQGVPRSLFIRSVVVAHDLIPFLFKNMYMPSWRRFYQMKQLRYRSRILQSVRAFYHAGRFKKGLKTLRKCTKILSNSQTTANDLVNIGRIPAKKITPIYLAPSFAPIIKEPSSKELEKSIRRIAGKYLLFIGGTDLRRQAHEIVFAFNLLNARGYDYSLVFAGSEFVENSKELNSTTKKAIEQSSYKDKIYMLGKINESDKRLVMENASAFVYPTLYEGFGFPILEAMAMGCPVITYESPATKEIAKDAALFVSPQDGWGIYDSILKLRGNADIKEKLIKKGLKRSGEFSWDATGKSTVDAVFNKF